MRHLKLAFILVVLTSFSFASRTFAQTDLSRPFAPWMSFETGFVQAEGGAADNQPAEIPRSRSTPAPREPKHSGQKMKPSLKRDHRAHPSPIEKAYSKRVLDEPLQFGYDLFGAPRAERDDSDERGPDATRSAAHQFSPSLPAGAVQDDFLLNIGDELQITFRGQRGDSQIYTINSQGQLILDDLPPITAAGRTIGQLREVLQAHAQNLINTQIYVALSSVRQAQVTVVGHVSTPGRQSLTVFHTVLDALMAAGGVTKQGSLRQIKLVRGGRSTYIDLYSLLIHGSAVMDLGLRDGDRLIVPPIGPTVAITGSVNRPGIYELLPAVNGFRYGADTGAQPLSLGNMLNLAGGVLNAGQNRFLRLGLTRDGRETVEPVEQDRAPVFDNGSILVVAPSDGMRTGMVELAGHTRQPGLHSLEKAANLSALLPGQQVFGPDIYPLLGVIERYDQSQLSERFVPFPPLLVVQGRFDYDLQDGDVVRLFSRQQILALQSPITAPVMPVAYGSALADTDEQSEDLINDPILTAFLAERAAFIRGAVRQEGAYPVAEGVSLENILAVAGGLTLEASTENIELTGHPKTVKGERRSVSLRETSPATIMVGAGDTIRVKQKFRRVADNSVLIIGEVAYPGRYDLAPGDMMADLLKRAGGLTDQAYPDGAIFSRESERKAEEARFRAQARELEIKLAAALEQKDEPDATQIVAAQELITQLKQTEAVGRITVEADPAMLAVQPELNILLQSGDRIFIPKRPLTVRVAGEVLSPAALQFRKDKAPRDYIMEAGGFTYHADKGRAFVVYPDGSAQPLHVSHWNHTATFIPPGATIIVPRDPKPFDFIETAKDVSQILSNLAITGIFLDDIHSDD